MSLCMSPDPDFELPTKNEMKLQSEIARCYERIAMLERDMDVLTRRLGAKLARENHMKSTESQRE